MKKISGFCRGLLPVHFLFIAIGSMAQVHQEWVARFPTSRTSFNEVVADMTIDRQGNVYVTGGTLGTGTDLDYTTIKYNTAGVLQWTARYNGTANGFDYATAIAIDEKGNVYVTGISEGLGSDMDYVTVKYNSSGVQQWAARYNGPGNQYDQPEAILADHDGNVYVTGRSVGSGTNEEDYATIKYGPNGAPKWIRRYNGPGNSADMATSLALDRKGNVLVTGRSVGRGTGEDYATIKYSSSGVQKWVARYNGTANNSDVGNSIAVDKGGNVYVTGSTYTGFVPGDPFDLALIDIATIKYNAAGKQQWVAIHDEGGTDEGRSVKLDKAGNLYVLANVSNSPLTLDEPDQDFGVIKYDQAGGKLWVAKYGPPADMDLQYSPNGYAIDKAGNVYVCGQSGYGAFTTIKFNKNGVLEWAFNYKSGVNQGAAAVEVDSWGNVYVSGSSDLVDCLGCYDFTTIKYAQYTCSKDDNKYLVCHKGNTLCLKKSEVDEHLCHGDKLGECSKDCDVPASTSELVNGDNGMVVPGKLQVSVAPNPAASVTKIYYELPVDGRVSIKVFDMLGKQVATLEDAARKAGFYNADFNVTTLHAGMYVYRITIKTAKGEWSETGKISVIK